MLHILLSTLKIIGILLLILIGLLLFLLLSGLLVPVRYNIRGEKDKEDWNARASLSWLFHALYISIRYDGKNPSYECYLFGIPLLRLKRWIDRRRAGKVSKARGKKRDESPYHPSEGNPPESIERKKEESGESESNDSTNDSKTMDIDGIDTDFQSEALDSKEAIAEKKLDSQESQKESMDDSNPKKEPENEKKEGIFRRIINKIKALLRLPGKICFTIRKNYGKLKEWKALLKSDDVKWLKKMGISRTKAVIAHVKPRRIRGDIKFGFDNPANTGEVLGVLGIIYPILPRKLTIIPNFTEAILEGWLEARGRIYGVFFLIQTLQILFDGKTIPIIRKYMRKEA